MIHKVAVERCVNAQVEILDGSELIESLEDERVELRKDLRRGSQAKQAAESQVEDSRDKIGRLRHEMEDFLRFKDKIMTAERNAAKYKGLLEAPAVKQERCSG
jgi:chromosome segregation ATPase